LEYATKEGGLRQIKNMVNSEMSELLQIRCHSRQSGQNHFELKPACTMQCKGPFGDK
jgi:hypothetical protein